MATYGQRDKFIQAIVTFTISEQAKEIPAPERQELLLKIRDKYAPDISNGDWGEIAKGVNNFKFVITDTVKYGEVPHIEDQLPDSQSTNATSPHIDESMKRDEYKEKEKKKDEDEDEDEDNDNTSTDYGVDESNDGSEEIKTNEDNTNKSDDDGETEEDDYEEPKQEQKQEPPTHQFGRMVSPKEAKPGKINTTRLKGLLKPKKTE